MNKAVEFLKDCGVFYLATAQGDKPRVRPFGAVTEFDGGVYICTGNKKDVFAQMIKNPNVELSATNAAGDWIRISARAVPVSGNGPKEAMRAEYPGIKDMYSEREDEFSVFGVTDASAVIFFAAGGTENCGF